MKKDQVYCLLDFETYSEADLKAVGAYEYSVHPTTEVLCFSYRVGTKAELKETEIKTWWPDSAWADEPGDVLAEIEEIFADSSILLVAHNAFFDHMIARHVLSRHTWDTDMETPFERWVCTASLAAALALPRSLEGACDALKLSIRKDMEGNKLTKKWCKPRKPTKKDPSKRHSDKAEFKRLVEYCENDIEAMTELFLTVRPLAHTERKIWCVDQQLNFRGFLVDRPLIETALKMIETEKGNIAKETQELTLGVIESTAQAQALRAYLNDEEGLFLPDLQKETVEEALSSGLASGVAKRLLELRQQASLTSLAKYVTAEQRSRWDGRIRDAFFYWGASTGRWVARGFQPQNLPRGILKNSILAAELIAEGDLDLIRLLYGDPLPVLSSCLRNVVIAAPKHTLDVADYNAIEVRVLFWLAGNEVGLEAFRKGVDLYKLQAASVFNIPVENIEDGSFERFVGKELILGCGFGLGHKRFMESCAKRGREIAVGLAKTAVDTYRRDNPSIPNYWKNIEAAAIGSVLAGSCNRYREVRGTRWYMDGDFLWCDLPSGRKLAYYGPEVHYEKTPWGEKKPVLYHMGVDSKTKKWVLQKTWGGTLVENVTQAVARDIVAEAMLRTEARGWKTILTVHDELASERPIKSSLSNAEFCRIMEEVPDWAGGCPIKVKGWEGIRFKKE